MANASVLISILLVCLVTIGIESTSQVTADQIQLSEILPKLKAIHEDAKSLLKKNTELKTLILAGVQVQAKSTNILQQFGNQQQVINAQGTNAPAQKQLDEKNADSHSIDYAELEEFNKWVNVNLDYAVKNTQASIEALKEEAQHNNGNVDYSEQAIQDGIEGVRYWQSAVIFQDKTLKNEKFVAD